MTPPWRSQGSPSQRVAHEHPSPLRPALATPSVEQPGSTSAAEDELLGSDSVLRRFRMRHAEKLGALSGRSAHASIEEQINELYAWAGYLAHDLERAGARIAAMKEEGTRAEAKHAGLEDHIRFLEWRCSERHISELEADAERLQAELDDAKSEARLHELQEAKAAAAAARSAERDAAEQVERERAALAESRDEAMSYAAELTHSRQALTAEKARRVEAEAEAAAARSRAEQAEARVAALEKSESTLQERAKSEAKRAARAKSEALAARESAAHAHDDAVQLALVTRELSCVREQLQLETRTRADAEVEAGMDRERIDVAMRACKQANDEAKRLRRKLKEYESAAHAAPCLSPVARMALMAPALFHTCLARVLRRYDPEAAAALSSSCPPSPPARPASPPRGASNAGFVWADTPRPARVHVFLHTEQPGATRP